MLIRYHSTVMVNKENYYGEYKGHTKWLSLISSHFAENIFFGMTLLHAHAHYICIVCAKYEKDSVKVWCKLISSCMHYQRTNITPI